MYVIQLCFICRPSDSTVSEDTGFEPRTVATLALTARHSHNHSARSVTAGAAGVILEDDTVGYYFKITEILKHLANEICV